MSKPKIAFFLYTLGSSGGAERVVTNLANNLCHDYEVHVITIVDIVPFYSLKPEIIVSSCFSSITPSNSSWQALKNNFLILKRVRSLLLENNIAVLISFMTTANITALLATMGTRIPLIISERNYPKRQVIAMYWKVLRFITYPMADYLVVQSTQIRDFFAKKISKRKLRILPNPISRELSQNRNSNSSKQKVILNVGSLTNQKAQDVLIQAFAKTNRNDWKLLIVGEGPLKRQLETQIQDLNLESQVLLLGQRKDIHEYYNKAKIFAFTSIYEGFPNALIEAMHFGLACISTDCPTGPSELIVDGKNGFLTPIGDTQLIAEKLNLLMDSDDLINEFATEAVTSVAKYEIENVIVSWSKLIESSLKN